MVWWSLRVIWEEVRPWWCFWVPSAQHLQADRTALHWAWRRVWPLVLMQLPLCGNWHERRYRHQHGHVGTILLSPGVSKAFVWDWQTWDRTYREPCSQGMVAGGLAGLHQPPVPLDTPWSFMWAKGTGQLEILTWMLKLLSASLYWARLGSS